MNKMRVEDLIRMLKNKPADAEIILKDGFDVVGNDRYKPANWVEYDKKENKVFIL